MVWSLLAASEATTASKQPPGSNLTSNLESVTTISYIPMVALSMRTYLHLIPTEENQGPLTCVAIAAGKNMECSGSILVLVYSYKKNVKTTGAALALFLIS